MVELPYACDVEDCSREFALTETRDEHAMVHTFADIESLLRREIRKTHGWDAFLTDVSSEWLVWDSFDEDAELYRMWRASYSIGEDLSVEIGEPEEVWASRVYSSLPAEVEAARRSYRPRLKQMYASAEGDEAAAPAADLPHDFAQDGEDAASSIWCSDCGRFKNDPIHHGLAKPVSVV